MILAAIADAAAVDAAAAWPQCLTCHTMTTDGWTKEVPLQCGLAINTSFTFSPPFFPPPGLLPK